MVFQRNILVIVAIPVVFIALGAIIFWVVSSKQAVVVAPPAPFVPISSTSTRNPAPSSVMIPDVGAKNVAANVAVPSMVTPSLPNTDTNFRQFAMRAEGNVFSPAEVIARVGDIVHIDLTAVDHEYDFTQPDFGIRVSVMKGQTKPVEFNASASGQFTFYCASCGGPAKGPIGYIVIANK